MREILLATGNPGKAKEMSEILTGAANGYREGSPPAPQIRWRHLSEFADRGWPDPVEDAATFLGNAVLKAMHYARLSGLWTIADDSGLMVDALGGEPGVRSARYAGEPKNDRANNALLISKLAGVPIEQRTARFCCAVVLAGRGHSPRLTAGSCGSPGQAGTGGTSGAHDIQILAEAEGKVEGRIIDEPRGTNGFGYDPHFHVDRLGMTTAEMASDQKHAISHRGQALRQLREKLARVIEQEE